MKNAVRLEKSAGSNIVALAKRAGLDGFVLALMLMIFLACFGPGPAKKTALFLWQKLPTMEYHLYFFYGLRLDLEKLKAGLRNWPLHLVVHFTTFIAFPLLVLMGKFLFENDSNHLLWLGIFFLASLPSTVSSSVVMVSIAGGNLPAAIFNASISSLMGVFITPLWMNAVVQSHSGGTGLAQIMGKLVVQVVVPVILGMILHRNWGWFAEKYKKQLRYFDQSIILLIVYTSFCESFAKRMFSGYSLSRICILGAGMVGLFFLVYALVKAACLIFKFNRDDTITAVFCGSKKSLVHGTVMSKVLFPGSDIVGIILLPLMLYHALQLVIASVIAQSMARKE